MLDVHPPHHAANSWRDFFIHIATIVIGLLIAIGLEQTVEYFHHRHQVAETRRSLEAERRLNQVIFDSAVTEFRRHAPILNGSLQTLLYLREHPGAPSSQWPGRFSFYMLTVQFQDAAWKTAQETAVLEYMPRSEVRAYSALYARLARLTAASEAEREATFNAKTFMRQFPDASKMTLEQNAQAYALLSEIAKNLALMGNDERNLSRLYKDFHNPPSDEEFYGLLPPAPSQQDVEAVHKLSGPVDRALAAQDEER